MARQSWNSYKKYEGRKTDFRDATHRFLIVSEGEKTEPNYFHGFKVPKDVIVDIEPKAGTHISVVERAIEVRDAAPGEYDQVWCVFDRDKDVDNPKNIQNFNEALALAKRQGIQVAYTNDAFELWYLLHFNYHDTAISRKQYGKLLTKHLGVKYEKGDAAMYTKLEAKMTTGISNAKKLLATYDKPVPSKDDPSTTVHLLVEELLKFSE